MIGGSPTFSDSMRSITDDLFVNEKPGGIVSITLGHGFPWGDTADTGTRAALEAFFQSTVLAFRSPLIVGRCKGACR